MRLQGGKNMLGTVVRSALSSFFVLLAAVWFILGGRIAPAIMLAIPYCDSCQRYMKSKVIGSLPARVPLRKIPKKDWAAHGA